MDQAKPQTHSCLDYSGGTSCEPNPAPTNLLRTPGSGLGPSDERTRSPIPVDFTNSAVYSNFVRTQSLNCNDGAIKMSDYVLCP